MSTMRPRALRMLRLLLALGGVACQTSSDQVTYQHPGATAADQRVLTSVLGESLSVRDFGATGSCLPEGRDVDTNATCATDDTPAFVAALAWIKAARWTGGQLHVPAGEYRIDGTINLESASMYLQQRARLKRVKLSKNTAPVVRLASYGAKLSGEGTISSMNPTPRGVVNIGQENRTVVPNANIEFCSVSGVYIQGPGCSWTWIDPSVSHPELNHSVGLAIDSSESLVNSGATYQNRVHGLTVTNVDIGVYLGNDVNCHTISDVNMASIGQVAYHLDYRATENLIKGGFVAGGGGIVTIFKCDGCSENWMIGVSGEPGKGSRFFDIDCYRPAGGGPCYTVDPRTGKPIMRSVEPVHNAVLGNDNCEQGSSSTDPTFIFLAHGQMHLGDFNASKGFLNYSRTLEVRGPAYASDLGAERLAVSADAAVSGALKVQGEAAVGSLSSSGDLQVQGKADVGELTSGFPSTLVARSAEGSAAGVSAVEHEPTLLTGTDADAVQIAPLRLSAPGGAQAAYFEVTISGFGTGGGDCGSQPGCTYTGRYLVTPFNPPGSGAPTTQLAVETLVASKYLGPPWATGTTLRIPLSSAPSREVLVDVRSVGRATDKPVVSLV